MWFKQRVYEKFVEGIVTDILHDSQLAYDLRIKLKDIGENEIKSIVYKISNQKIKADYPMNLRAFYNIKLKKEIKTEFFEILRKRY
jgi:hypothetical protein